MSDERSGPSIRGPLEGIRVVECAVWHAGPGAGAILGDLGAEVIKVETLQGDPERHFGKFGPMGAFSSDVPDWCLMFDFSNRNKKGICVDTDTPEGREVLDKLVRGADVFITNLRATTRRKVGVDYATISQINPKIIHANVSGFGPNGTMADVGGFDPMGQAVSGMIYLTGQDEPVLLQALLLDQLTAIAASHGILTALFARERNGVGQEIHTSLYGSAVWLMHANLLTSSMLKDNIATKWERTKNTVLRTCYKCKDGKWIMGTNHPEEKYWVSFCDVIERNDLLTDPRFETFELRRTNVLDLIAIIDATLLFKTQREWLALFQQRGLNFCPIQQMVDVLVDPQAEANGYVVDYQHPLLGNIRIPGYPISFGANAAGMQAPAPGLGEHTRTVLSDLGYSKDAIDRMMVAGVLK